MPRKTLTLDDPELEVGVTNLNEVYIKTPLPDGGTTTSHMTPAQAKGLVGSIMKALARLAERDPKLKAYDA